MKKLGLVLGLLIALNLNATSWEQQTGWVIAYENDKDGNKVNGSVESLISAIKNGADVKIGTTISDIDSFLLCNTIYIKDTIVSCMITNQVSQVNLEKFNSDIYHVYILANTNGDRAISRWLIGKHENKAPTKDNINIKWFVRTH